MSEQYFTPTQGNVRVPTGKRMDVAGTLSVAPGGTLSVTGGGTLEVAAGGTLSAVAGSTVTMAGAVTLNDPSYFRADNGTSLLNHLAIDEPMFRFYFDDFATPTIPACYFAADGGLYTGSSVTICATNSTGVAQGSGYSGDQVIYYRPMAWNQELANYLNHPASSTPGYSPLATYMLGLQNDINGPTILSVQQGNNAGGSNPQGAMFLGCITDFLTYRARFAMAHDFPAGTASSANSWFYIGDVVLETVCLDTARGPGISATNYDDAFDIALGRTAAKVMALKGNGANGAGINLRNFDSATPTNVPTAPSDGQVIIFRRHNGSGKGEVCALFESGAVQVIATEP